VFARLKTSLNLRFCGGKTLFALSNARLQAVPTPKLKAKFVTKSRIAAFGAVGIKFSQRLYGKFRQILHRVFKVRPPSKSRRILQICKKFM